MRVFKPTVRTVTKCRICIMKEEGVENPEDYVLPQYQLSMDKDRLPIPLDIDDELQSGILILYPEQRLEQTGITPQSGGVVGTVKSIFKVLGLLQPEPTEPAQSKEVAKQKRKRGLYD